MPNNNYFLCTGRMDDKAETVIRLLNNDGVWTTKPSIESEAAPEAFGKAMFHKSIDAWQKKAMFHKSIDAWQKGEY